MKVADICCCALIQASVDCVLEHCGRVSMLVDLYKPRNFLNEHPRIEGPNNGGLCYGSFERGVFVIDFVNVT